jgi:bifunctional polynucleotide phosphatase/kinase
MWDELVRVFAADGVQIGVCAGAPGVPCSRARPDHAASIFVGDAAGRKGDFACTDRKWALNVGIAFQTPEVGRPGWYADARGAHCTSCRRSTSSASSPPHTRFRASPSSRSPPVSRASAHTRAADALAAPAAPPAPPVAALSALALAPGAAPVRPELCLFVGLPVVGKTRFFRAHFALAGYAHVNQDALGTRAKCVCAATDALAAGTSVVVGACVGALAPG